MATAKPSLSGKIEPGVIELAAASGVVETTERDGRFMWLPPFVCSKRRSVTVVVKARHSAHAAIDRVFLVPIRVASVGPTCSRSKA
jgi:hypothetical protein